MAPFDARLECLGNAASGAAEAEATGGAANYIRRFPSRTVTEWRAELLLGAITSSLGLILVLHSQH